MGLLVGDALGVPYEFHDPADIPPASEVEFDPPAGFRRAHTGTPPGTWSDDGAQALCLLASLLECERFDADDFAQRLVRWSRKGYMAVDGRVFDIGITTSRALTAIEDGVPPLQAGPAGENDNGNGSLMRVLPLALWHTGTDAELVRDARDQSRVTHGHIRSQLCCALYCLWARCILADSRRPWEEATTALRAILQEDEAGLQELEASIRPDELVPGQGSGYVLDSLRAARWLQREGDYEHVVRAAIALGHDTDTTACIAGGIAGLEWGVEDIPARWRDALRGRDIVEPLLAGLVKVRGKSVT